MKYMKNSSIFEIMDNDNTGPGRQPNDAQNAGADLATG